MSVIDEHLEKVSDLQRAELERIRNIVKQTIPEAEEVISYGMPGFKYKKKYLIGFAVFKDHMSVFPTAAPIEAIRGKLDGFELSKGTIQFTLENPIPDAIVKELIMHRVASIDKG